MSPTPHCSHKQRSNIKRVHFHLLSTNSLNHLLRDCCCSKGSPLPLQRIVQLLSIGAFELRKGISDRFEANGIEEKENQQQKYLNKLIRNERLLIELGVVDTHRLTKWVDNFYNNYMEKLIDMEPYFINKFGKPDQLENLCLQLSNFSLPQVCKPRVVFLSSNKKLNTRIDRIVYQARSEVTARVDIAGGWTDTPPITYQMGKILPAVLSLSILVNGKRPIRCKCSRLEMLQGIFYRENSYGEQQPLLVYFLFSSLLCSILVVAGFVREELWGGERHYFFDFAGSGRGLLIETESDLPHGSGLGSSSILAGALLAALHKLSGNIEQIKDQLINQVLQIEQLHTSGGGWQDQLGGCITGGAKIGWVESNGKRKCCWRSVPLGGELIKEFSKRFVLLYTGKTRLAKTLLKQVLLSWARQEPQILKTVERLAEGAWKAEEMLIEGKFPSEICTEYNEFKKIFASNTEPSLVTELKKQMEKENLIESAWMAGAGGGGFLYIWLKEGKNNVLEKLENLLKSDRRWKGMNIWRVELENKEPLIVE
uniref:GHMP_kinases_N domain-containing protein n=1 Tax=Meloidogyne hapla TaxID=6305 RepID=A0A1I8BSM9_MELHA